MNNRNVILSADSTCDLGEELKSRYQVHYYPFHIILNGKEYQDNVDISTEEIYRAYYKDHSLPQTAAINAAEYVEYFRQFTDQGYEVIHLNLGGALSSAHQNCLLAARELKGVYPIDSQNLSTGIALQVIAAADMIERGCSALEIVTHIKELRTRCHASFILDTLDFMHAGGRCSSVVALGAGILSLKPCIEVDNRTGAMSVGKKYRGKLSRVLVRYTKDQLEKYDHIRKDHIFITHSGIDPSLIEDVRNTILENGDFSEIHVTKASCTISAHCGPNTLGVLFLTD